VTGKFAGKNKDERTSISGNYLGFWAKDVPDEFRLEDVNFEGNFAVSIGSSGATTKGFIVCRFKVEKTIMAKTSVIEGGLPGAMRKEVGDGFAWLDGSEVQIADAVFSENARNSILINGSATGKLKNVKLEGGDDVSRPILQQNYDGMAQPTVENDPMQPAIMIETDATERFPVPAGPP